MSKNPQAVRRFHPQCIDCLFNKYVSRADLAEDDEIRIAYTERLEKILRDADSQTSPPEVIEKITALLKELLGVVDSYEAEKRHFNALMLSKEASIQAEIEGAADPLHVALNFALLGNYIDFGAMNSVDEDKLALMLKGAVGLEYRDDEYNNLRVDLSKAKRLVYLTDNCGEIVADKLFIKAILACYPHLDAEVIVKGAPVLNDATLEDAGQVGLQSVVKVSHNGSGLAGTCLNRISDEAKTKIEDADIIIAKGQANFETLRHCGKNVYYIFMCKCKLFAERFNLPTLSGMMLNDLRMGDL